MTTDLIIDTLLHLPEKLLQLIRVLPSEVLFQVRHIETLIKNMSWESVLSQMYVLAEMIKNIDSESLLQFAFKCNMTMKSYMPTISYVFFQIFDGIFAPKQLVKQLTLALILQVAVSGVHWLSYFINYSLLLATSKGRKVLSANHRLNEAKTFEEWKTTAEELDHLNGTVQTYLHGCIVVLLYF